MYNSDFVVTIDRMLIRFRSHSLVKAVFDLKWQHPFFSALLIGGVVFVMAMLGILSRPTGLLAAFWPANAVLLGLFIRFPRCASLSGLLTAFLAFATADLVSGSTLSSTLILTTGNLSGVITAYLLFKHFTIETKGLNQPSSIIYLVFIVAASSAVVGLVGMIANPILFNGTPLDGLKYWFVTELVNYLTVLPVLLTFPAFIIQNSKFRKISISPIIVLKNLMPVISLLFSMLLAVEIGGSVALTFLMPSLLWCAVRYDVFVTAVLTLFCSTWVLLATATGVLDIGISYYDHRLLEALRFGVTLISLAPLTVSAAITSQNQLIKILNHASTHDSLTDALNRRGFLDSAEALFVELSKSNKPVAVMMLDIDWFKRLNDMYGHKVGDRVLAEFTRMTSRFIREADLFGRIGGEEFAIVTADCTLNEAKTIAHRICAYFSNNPISISNELTIKMTVSIGLAFMIETNKKVEAVLDIADKELYKAKSSGRNRVSLYQGIMH